MTAKHRITINLIESEYEALLALSEKNRVSMAWLGRRAISEMLERYEKRESQLPLDVPQDGQKTE